MWYPPEVLLSRHKREKTSRAAWGTSVSRNGRKGRKDFYVDLRMQQISDWRTQGRGNGLGRLNESGSSLFSVDKGERQGKKSGTQELRKEKWGNEGATPPRARPGPIHRS
jgi:hypothetical protein